MASLDVTNDRFSATQVVNESAFIDAFVLAEKRARWLSMIHTKRRSKLMEKLAGGDDFVQGSLVKISNAASLASVETEIVRNCSMRTGLTWIMSNYHKLDSQSLSLTSALDAVIGLGLGSVVLVESGGVAYYETEVGNRFLLISKPNAKRRTTT